MTGKQRALAAIRGQSTDRPSVLPSIDVAYAPECISSCSERVVLPASTWAKMPMLRMFMGASIDVLGIV